LKSATRVVQSQNAAVAPSHTTITSSEPALAQRASRCSAGAYRKSIPTRNASNTAATSQRPSPSSACNAPSWTRGATAKTTTVPTKIAAPSNASPAATAVRWSRERVSSTSWMRFSASIVADIA
jgi:hypothetical protein